ncbi:MAG: hypothetical protein JNM55_03225 [Anaerolineales bacterium]|nr:hypothetical protein [Anaerolineales bacterium]
MKTYSLYFLVLLILLLTACGPSDNGSIPTVPGAPTAFGGPTVEGLPTVPGAPTAFGAPTVEGLPTVPGAPTAFGAPTVEGLPTVPGAPTALGAPTAYTGPVTPDSANNHCSLFDGSNFSIVMLDWQAGQPLTFYIKMPGGVPGLEKPIEGDNGPWDYYVNFGAYQTQDCKIQPGYPERLYCSIFLPAEYANSSQVLELYVSGCNVPVYQDLNEDVPSMIGSLPSSGGASCSLSCPASCEPNPSCTVCQGIGGGSCKP